MNPYTLTNYAVLLWSALLCFAMFCAACITVLLQSRKYRRLRTAYEIALQILEASQTKAKEYEGVMKDALRDRDAWARLCGAKDVYSPATARPYEKLRRDLDIQISLGAELTRIKEEWKARALTAESRVTELEEREEQRNEEEEGENT